MRSRAYQAHLAAQDIEELRQLVDAGRADDPPDARDARIVSRRGVRPGLAAVAHRPELEHPEQLVAAPDAGLDVEHRAAAFQPEAIAMITSRGSSRIAARATTARSRARLAIRSRRRNGPVAISMVATPAR
jgi:hypothetical protein